jgi:hypothetical protein
MTFSCAKQLYLLMLAAAFVAASTACDPQSSKAGSESTGIESTAPGDATAGNESTEKLTVIQFDTLFHDFGEVVEGQKVTHRYTFTNSGTNPLIIQKVKPSCGCTSPSYTTEPVPPGGKGYVDLQFDSANKDGETRKSALVIANTDPASTKLEYRALVVPSKK